jgi:hypothetical protein
MADTVSTVVLFNQPKRLVTKHLNLSDGTGESNVVKVDKSTYTGPDGTEPSCFAIEKIEYAIVGMSVAISIDQTTDVKLFQLSDTGCLDFTSIGGVITRGDGSGTGDILFTTNGHTSGDTYDITLYLRKKD